MSYLALTPHREHIVRMFNSVDASKTELTQRDLKLMEIDMSG